MELMLSLEQSSEYKCQVEYYSIGHGLLAVKATNNQDTFYLHFRHVICFSGMMRWQGVNLSRGNEDEYFAFLDKVMPNYAKPFDTFIGPHYYNLYLFETTVGTVALIASDYEKTTTLT